MATLTANGAKGAASRWRGGGVALALAAALVGCRRAPEPKATIDAGPPLPRTAPTSDRPTDPAPRFDLVANLPRCDLSREGPVIDLGSPASPGLEGAYPFAPDPAVVDVEHDGATWARIGARTVSYRFLLEAPANVLVAARVKGGASRAAGVSLDGHPLGTLSFARGQVRVATTRSTTSPVAAGEHTVTLRFSGGGRTTTEPFAELDWLHLGIADDAASPASAYAAPTLREVSYSTTLGGVPHRTIALRAGSAVRCTTAIAPGARLHGVLGFAGPGEGEAEIRAVSDGAEPLVLETRRVLGGDQATWGAYDVPLDALAGKVAAIELVAKGGTPGGRVLFGDPAVVVRAGPPAEAPRSRLVVVVVMSGLVPSQFPPQTAEGALPALAELERASTTFLRHRAPTTVTAGVMASLLTGLSPRAHTLEDPSARLPTTLTTIATAARDGSVQTAMFTGSPTTFAPFGFARGWDEFAAFSPVEGAPAIAPIAEAGKWIVKHLKTPSARALVVVHARGGHPPWDVTPQEASNLPPPEYSGPMEARRSAEVIARAREKKSHFRLTENDRTRMWALYEWALAGQDRAMGALVDLLRKEGLWDATTFVVTGDVSVPATSHAPFGDGEELAEEQLAVPLFVHFAGGAQAGVRVDAPTAMVDVGRTALAALGLEVPKAFEGTGLYAMATGGSFPSGRALRATLGNRYSSRWGDLLLAGAAGRPPTLCDLAADPACETNRLETMPLAARSLFRFTYDDEAAARKARRATREPATIDADTAAALQVWGQ